MKMADNVLSRYWHFRDLEKYLPLALLAFALLSGCIKVGPDFHRPDTRVSPDWVESDNNRIRSEPADFRAWWKVFNDPALDKFIAMAYSQNPSLQIAGTRVLQARAQIGVAVGEIFPQAPITGSFQRNRSSEAASFRGGFNYTEAQVSANLSWELDFWGRFRRAIEAADALWFSSLANYDNTLVSLTADVANSYIQIRTLQKRIDIANLNAVAQKENLGIAEARFRFGLVSELDVEQARTALNSTLSAIPPLETQLRQSYHALCLLLGIPPEDLGKMLPGPPEIPSAPLQVAIGIPADLLRRRPDIRMAEYQANAQCAQIGIAKAELYPAFSLGGFFGFLSTDVAPARLGDITNWGSRQYQYGASFQWNILNYGRIINNIRFQDAVFEEYLITYRNTVLSAQRDVEDNLVAFLKAQDRARLLGQSSSAAKRALDLAVLQYKSGARDFTTVITAQQALLTEQDNLASTLGTLSSSVVGIYRALGGGWETREGQELIPREIKSEMARRTNWGELLSPKSYNPSPADKPDPLLRLLTGRDSEQR